MGDKLKGVGTGHSKQEAQTKAAEEGVRMYNRKLKS